MRRLDTTGFTFVLSNCLTTTLGEVGVIVIAMRLRRIRAYFRKGNKVPVFVAFGFLGIAYLSAMIAMMYADQHDPESLKALSELQHEMELIGSPAGSVQIRKSELHRIGFAKVQKEFTWIVESVDFYHSQLTKEGWQATKDFSTDPVAISREYRKGRYSAMVECNRDLQNSCTITLKWK